jgi:hypothetical protein
MLLVMVGFVGPTLLACTMTLFKVSEPTPELLLEFWLPPLPIPWPVPEPVPEPPVAITTPPVMFTVPPAPLLD